MNQFTNNNRTYKTGSFVMGRMNHKMVGKIAFAFGLLFAAAQLNAAEEVYAPEVGEGRYIASGPARVQTISPSAGKPPLPDVSVADLNGLNVKNGWRLWRKNRNINDQPLQIGENVYQAGLGMHADAEITYALKPDWKRFVATVGVHVDSGQEGSVQFIVEVDGTELGRSPVLTGKSPAHHFNITLPKGTQQIRLISNDGGDGNAYDHANWVNCGFIISGVKNASVSSAEENPQSWGRDGIRLIKKCLVAIGLAYDQSLPADPALKAQSLADLEQRLVAIDHELQGLARFSLISGAGAIGYRSRAYSTPEESAWVEIQFEQAERLDELMLVPALWRNSESGFQSDGFPEAFRVFAGTAGDEQGKLIAEVTQQDDILPRIAPLVIPLKGVLASWVRIETTHLSPRAVDENLVFQLAEMLVFSGEENMALHRSLNTSPNEMDGGIAWDPSYATDGFLPYIMHSGQSPKRQGYLSRFSNNLSSASAPPSLTIDLQQIQPITRIHLHALSQGDTVPQASTESIGFPQPLQIEGAVHADFSDRRLLLDLKHESPYDRGPIMTFNLPETHCRYVRLTALKPYIYEKGPHRKGRIGFAEIEIYSGGKSVALGKAVSSSFKEAQGEWSPLNALTDGSNIYGVILPLREWLNQLARRHDLETERPRVSEELLSRYARQQTNLRRMIWLAALLTFGIGFTILINRTLRMREMNKLRERLAADLHDELGANLHTIGLLSDLAEKNKAVPHELSRLHKRMRDLTERTGTAVRHCTGMLEKSGLYTGLVEDMQRAAQRIMAKLDHRISIEGEEFLAQLNPRTRVDLFLFYNECLVNIGRHSGATQFSTHLVADAKQIRLVIADNGRGLERVPPSLKRRARLLGAKITIQSPEAGGTRIQLAFQPHRNQRTRS